MADVRHYGLLGAAAGAALTDGRADVKLLLAESERKRFGTFFSSAVRSPYNKRTMEAGLSGIWAFRPNAKSISYVLST